MPRIPTHTVDSAPDQSRAVLHEVAAQVGKVLNIHGGMAHAPVVLHSYAALQGVIAEHGTLDARTREAIALTVAAVDECTYCQSAHTASGKAAGLTRDEMIAIREGSYDSDRRLAALLAVAREATADTGYVADATWQEALEAGWSDAELAEVTTHMTVNLLANYFNHMVGTELDLPAAPQLRSESAA
ncbi:carboxymuconolactone decarboxylase family protein [Ornithinimicrobium sediminis]|uniref:carboxymuconolactone decarboxylase family protein n=1 Tax=Ornithinimicrobium sediminis TaxID=2904603 RepID=UPI001E500991|nr:carboxymuconolactone decarboxylase family protein [Ornithinimicrobium sediminis]MCE0485811.1 carboxymuconolactone decarboxylase family protein [Ornithinimicrobium sediminis]